MRLPTLSPVARVALTAAPLILLGAGPASAQLVSREAVELHDEIYQLQQQVQALRQQVAQQGQSTPTDLGGYSNRTNTSSGSGELVTQLLQKVEDLSQQVRDLRGQVQEADNQIQQQGADLGKRIGDLQFQIDHPGMKPPPAPGASGSPSSAMASASGTTAASGPKAPAAAAMASPPPAPLGTHRAPPEKSASAEKPRNAEALLRQGEAAFARRDYHAAEQAAHEVVNKYRTSSHAYDAQYLLAESLQGQRRYPQAAIAYDDVYNRARKGRHAQQALIGLAASLTAINENQAACDTLTKLHKEFRRQSPAIRQVAAELHKRARCK